MRQDQGHDVVDFSQDLLRLFFNPKSYFFAAFSKQLQDLSTLAKNIEEDDYILIAQVMEYLKDVKNPLEELNRLGEIERIHDFEITMEEIFHQLRQPNLAKSEIENKIKLLATDFVDSLIDVMHEHTDKKRLLELITTRGDDDDASIDDAWREAEDYEKTSESELHFNNEDDMQPSASDILQSGRDQDFSLGETYETKESSESVKPNDAPDDIELDLSEFEFSPIEDDMSRVVYESDETKTEPQEIDLRLEENQPENAVADPGDYDIDFKETPQETTVSEEKEYDINFEEKAPEAPDFNPELPDEPEEFNDDNDNDLVQFEAIELEEMRADNHSVENRPQVATSKYQQAKKEFDLDEFLAENEKGPQVKQERHAQESVQNPPKSAMPHEPGMLKNAFLQEADLILDRAESYIQKLKPNKNVQSTLKKLEHDFLDLRESAMVHGFIDLEEIARKGELYFSRLKFPYRHLSQEDIAFIRGLLPTVRLGLKEHLSDAELQKIKKLLHNFGETDALIRSINTHTAHQQEIETSLPADSEVDFLSKKSVKHADREEASWRRNDIKSELKTDDEYETNNQEIPDDKTQERSPLKLPGEDDPELIELIREVSDHAVSGKTQPEENAESEKSYSNTFDPKELTIRDDYLDSGSIEFNEIMGNFHAEAELYYRVIFESLSKLGTQANDRLALENLELAAYSLKGLARKLGLDPLARLPELVEDLITKVLLLHLPCTEKPLQIMKRGFEILKSIKAISDIEKTNLKDTEREVLQFIESLDFFAKPAMKKMHGKSDKMGS